MAPAPKTVTDLETPIADALMMAEIVAELVESAMGSVSEDALLNGAYHGLTTLQADRILWAAYDAVARIKQIRADWNIVNDAGPSDDEEARQ